MVSDFNYHALVLLLPLLLYLTVWMFGHLLLLRNTARDGWDLTERVFMAWLIIPATVVTMGLGWALLSGDFLVLSSRTLWLVFLLRALAQLYDRSEFTREQGKTIGAFVASA